MATRPATSDRDDRSTSSHPVSGAHQTGAGAEATVSRPPMAGAVLGPPRHLRPSLRGAGATGTASPSRGPATTESVEARPSPWLAPIAPAPEPATGETAPTDAARFVVLQRWEGIVQEVDGDGFWANLDDLADVRPSELVKLPLARVDHDDRWLLVPGGVFYWTIGHRLGSPDVLSDHLRFRRVPQWQPGDLERAMRDGAELRRRLTAAGTARESN